MNDLVRTNDLIRTDNNLRVRVAIIESGILHKLFKILPDKPVILFNYVVFYNRLPDLKNPRLFSEKIQWIKLYGNLEKYTQYVDKYEVRKYINKIIGKNYLVPLIGVWDTFEDIPFEKLPQKFVLKATHGSGYNFICKDKSLVDKRKLKRIVNKWIKGNYYQQFREIQYKSIVPRIICEEYLEGQLGLINYRFFCSGGKPVVIGLLSEISNLTYVDFFDLNWKKLPIFYRFENSKSSIKKPKELDKMILIAKKLSKIFPFVGVDFYAYEGEIYFSELTFTPGGSWHLIKPSQADYQLGKIINLSRF